MQNSLLFWRRLTQVVLEKGGQTDVVVVNLLIAGYFTLLSVFC